MKPVFGVIVGNRGFFPDELVKEGREEILQVFGAMDCEAVILGPEDTKLGAVETLDDAKKCARLFSDNAEKIDGVIVTLPNFGDERGVADAIKLSRLDVPVLIQASPDDPARAHIGRRRDSFCGKISVCNNLFQYEIPYSITASHTVAVDSDEFREDLSRFMGITRVVKGLRNARIGAIGARPANFNTVRYSEKILESYGVSVVTIDLSEIFGRIEKLTDSAQEVTARLESIKAYAPTNGIEDKYLLKMAKLGVVIDNFVSDNDLNATAIQCWTAMEEYLGIVPCTVMSMLSESLKPSACEVDVTGALAMYALQLAAGSPSALVDWNNNYGDDPDKCVLFHCSNLPRSFFIEPRMDFQEIIAGDVGKENTYGTCVGRIGGGPMTFARLSTDDINGELVSYVGEGYFTDDELETFGGYGVAEIPNLQDLMEFICTNGFEHHVAVNLSSVSELLHEAFTNYLGIDTYYHL
ncbi:MAG: L-fucose/L-arabinose isomerase family protein [Deltaproteobacteria bacterium]|nr:L-fucose/L-arabinose isomerase family protein [Deltaproteobacteria bacterium]